MTVLLGIRSACRLAWPAYEIKPGLLVSAVLDAIVTLEIFFIAYAGDVRHGVEPGLATGQPPCHSAGGSGWEKTRVRLAVSWDSLPVLLSTD